MRREVRAFAPGRVNLIGEHTDYNGGLALPFAIAQGITVRGWVEPSSKRRAPDTAPAGARIRARAVDIDEEDEFALPRPDRVAGWRAFVRGVASALEEAGAPVPSSHLELGGDIRRGAGLSSSAALEIALSLVLLALAGADELDLLDLARLCAGVESEWVGAQTGLLDQLASLLGKPERALLIDFASLDVKPVPLVLERGWSLAVEESGEHRELAASGYNERRAECARACELLGVGSLRELEGPGGVGRADLARLPERLARRVEHVLGENARVRAVVTALGEDQAAAIGPLLDESHASLRDLYECSTPAVEAAVRRCKSSGALGARMIGGGFGGSVLGLFPPDAPPPPGTLAVRPSAGARLLA
ncbi:MAG TPA: galactokinase family protein [Solirubrobacteraceae bacterium]|nr:galactokinase family protein [Solirubrobacteraceae bacterium]